jgi:hypothetical protein
VPVNKPVNVALVIEPAEVRTKSSADSISNGAPVSGHVAVAIWFVTAEARLPLPRRCSGSIAHGIRA